MNQLYFNGYSGCKITLHDNYIIKYSSSINYNNRLLNQLKKQQVFNLTKITDTLKVPIIHEINIDTNNLLYGKMEYINGLSFIQLFQTKSYTYIHNQFLIIFDYLKNLLKNSTFHEIKESLFFNKIKSIKQSNSDYNIFINKLNLSDLNFPIYECHGDLTLSNMIFKNDIIYLIDFLDSFIETPYQDIIKLRQDLRFMWSLTKIKDTNIDINKIKMVSYYLRTEFENMFKEYINTKSFHLLECMNYLRIVPYITDKKTDIYLKNVLKEII